MELKLYYKCPNCNELTEIDTSKDIEFTGSNCATCGYTEVSLVTLCKCGSIIETGIYP